MEFKVGTEKLKLKLNQFFPIGKQYFADLDSKGEVLFLPDLTENMIGSIFTLNNNCCECELVLSGTNQFSNDSKWSITFPSEVHSFSLMPMKRNEDLIWYVVNSR